MKLVNQNSAKFQGNYFINKINKTEDYAKKFKLKNTQPYTPSSLKDRN